MCTPECIIAMLGCPALNEAVKEAVKAVTKARKYVRQYRMHVDNLRTELCHLEDARVIIERRVCEVRDCGEEIENPVTHWQADAGQMENDVQELIGQVEARMHCFACSCPNIMWRYRLAKQAEEKIRDVQRLVEYNRHFEEISYPKPPPPELEFPSAENYVHLDSRTPIFEQIVVALKDPNVKTVGVHGLGGVGKTTLVEKVAKKLLDDRTFKQIPLLAVSKDAFPVLEINTIKVATINMKDLPWWQRTPDTSNIDPDLIFLVNGTSRKEVATEESGTSSKVEDNNDHNKEEEEDSEEDIKNADNNEGGRGGGGGGEEKDDEGGGSTEDHISNLD